MAQYNEVVVIPPAEPGGTPTTTISNLSGISIALSAHPADGKTLIHRVLPGGAAERAGLMTNDWIIMVDDKDTAGLGAESVAALLRGDPGTQVKVTVTREGASNPLEFNVTRELVRLPTPPPQATNEFTGNPLGPLIAAKEAEIAEVLARGFGERHPKITTLRAVLGGLKANAKRAEQNLEAYVLDQEWLLERMMERLNQATKEAATADFLNQQEIARLKARIAELSANDLMSLQVIGHPRFLPKPPPNYREQMNDLRRIEDSEHMATGFAHTDLILPYLFRTNESPVSLGPQRSDYPLRLLDFLNLQAEEQPRKRRQQGRP
ncbi:MAG: PDZ domain-containing protein [Chthoniobacterales bacterium]|nr:PDZ domain-containing protein [Chthoniobacterales bacterium]